MSFSSLNPEAKSFVPASPMVKNLGENNLPNAAVQSVAGFTPAHTPFVFNPSATEFTLPAAIETKIETHEMCGQKPSNEGAANTSNEEGAETSGAETSATNTSQPDTPVQPVAKDGNNNNNNNNNNNIIISTESNPTVSETRAHSHSRWVDVARSTIAGKTEDSTERGETAPAAEEAERFEEKMETGEKEENAATEGKKEEVNSSLNPNAPIWTPSNPEQFIIQAAQPIRYVPLQPPQPMPMLINVYPKNTQHRSLLQNTNKRHSNQQNHSRTGNDDVKEIVYPSYDKKAGNHRYSGRKSSIDNRNTGPIGGYNAYGTGTYGGSGNHGSNYSQNNCSQSRSYGGYNNNNVQERNNQHQQDYGGHMDGGKNNHRHQGWAGNERHHENSYRTSHRKDNNTGRRSSLKGRDMRRDVVGSRNTWKENANVAPAKMNADKTKEEVTEDVRKQGEKTDGVEQKKQERKTSCSTTTPVYSTSGDTATNVRDSNIVEETSGGEEKKVSGGEDADERTKEGEKSEEKEDEKGEVKKGNSWADIIKKSASSAPVKAAAKTVVKAVAKEKAAAKSVPKAKTAPSRPPAIQTKDIAQGPIVKSAGPETPKWPAKRKAEAKAAAEAENAEKAEKKIETQAKETDKTPKEVEVEVEKSEPEPELVAEDKRKVELGFYGKKSYAQRNSKRQQIAKEKEVKKPPPARVPTLDDFPEFPGMGQKSLKSEKSEEKEEKEEVAGNSWAARARKVAHAPVAEKVAPTAAIPAPAQEEKAISSAVAEKKEDREKSTGVIEKTPFVAVVCAKEETSIVDETLPVGQKEDKAAEIADKEIVNEAPTTQATTVPRTPDGDVQEEKCAVAEVVAEVQEEVQVVVSSSAIEETTAVPVKATEAPVKEEEKIQKRTPETPEQGRKPVAPSDGTTPQAPVILQRKTISKTTSVEWAGLPKKSPWGKPAVEKTEEADVDKEKKQESSDDKAPEPVVLPPPPVVAEQETLVVCEVENVALPPPVITPVEEETISKVNAPEMKLKKDQTVVAADEGIVEMTKSAWGVPLKVKQSTKENIDQSMVLKNVQRVAVPRVKDAWDDDEDEVDVDQKDESEEENEKEKEEPEVRKEEVEEEDEWEKDDDDLMGGKTTTRSSSPQKFDEVETTMRWKEKEAEAQEESPRRWGNHHDEEKSSLINDDKKTLSTPSVPEEPKLDVLDGSSPYTSSPSTNDDLSEDSDSPRPDDACEKKNGKSKTGVPETTDEAPVVTPTMVSSGTGQFNREFLLSLRYAPQCAGPLPAGVPEELVLGNGTLFVKLDKAPRKNRRRQFDSDGFAREEQPVLKSSETSWANRQKAHVDEFTTFARKVKSILNKMTMEKFEVLSKQLFEVGFENVKHVEILMDELWTKSTTQHHNISMYCSLCDLLNDYLREKNICQDDKENSFRKLLLNQCQESFAQNMRPREKHDTLEEDNEELVMRKKTMLGNMKFIGQLFVHQLIARKVMFSCIDELFKCGTEDAFETLCTFLLQVCPHFDRDDLEDTKIGRKHFDPTFETLQNFIGDNKGTKISSRIKFLFQDVIDLRKKNWQGKTLKNEPAGPSTLAEIKSAWAQDYMIPIDEREPDANGWITKSASKPPPKKEFSRTTSFSSQKKPAPSTSRTFSHNASFPSTSQSSTRQPRKERADEDNDNNNSRGNGNNTTSFNSRVPSEPQPTALRSSLSAMSFTSGCLRPGGAGLFSSKTLGSIPIEEEKSLLDSSCSITPSSGSTDGITRYSRKEIKEIGVSVSGMVESIPEEIVRREKGTSGENRATSGAAEGFEEKEEKDNWRTRSSPPRQQLDRGDWKKSKSKDLEPMPALVPSASSWSVGVRGESSEDERKIRQIKSILNKLTVEKYDSLYAKLIELEIESTSHVEELVKDLFLKATTQHHFIEMYTRLCVQFSEDWSRRKSEELEASGEEKELDEMQVKKARNEFKNLLSSRCQDLFEKMDEKPEHIDEIEDEDTRFEAHCLWKKKMIGNVKFVGQLVNQHMLPKKVLINCINLLLDNGSPDCLETLAAFLDIVGPEFDKADFKKKADLDKCFNEVKKLSEDTSQTTRIKCLLLDVLDRRAKGWSSQSSTLGPQKLDEVKESWAQDHGLNKEKSGASIPKVERDPEEFITVSTRKGKKRG